MPGFRLSWGWPHSLTDRTPPHDSSFLLEPDPRPAWFSSDKVVSIDHLDQAFQATGGIEKVDFRHGQIHESFNLVNSGAVRRVFRNSQVTQPSLQHRRFAALRASAIAIRFG